MDRGGGQRGRGRGGPRGGGGGGGDRGRGRGGGPGRGGFRGGNRGGGHGFGRQAPPSEVWQMPQPPPKSPAIGSLPPVTQIAAFPDEGSIIPLQKPRAPGTISYANVDCFTNYYELKIGQKYSAAYFYTVRIVKQERELKKTKSSEVPKVRKERRLGMKINRRIFNTLPRRECGDQLLAYDGRQRACGLKRIPNDALDLIVDFDGDKWGLTLTYEKAVPLTGVKPGPQFGRTEELEESLLSLAIMMNHVPSLSYTPLGRGFYGLPGETPVPINGGFELWSGYKAHVIPGAEKTYLNVNYAITAFIQPGKLIDMLPDLLQLRDRSVPPTLQPKQVAELKKKLVRCKAETSHLKTKKDFTIASVTNESASKISFADRDGRRVTVAEYFGKTHYKLKFPNLPCIQVGHDNPKYFPLEVIQIKSGNPYRGEQSPQLVSDIIKLAAIPPRNRLEEIRATVRTIRKQNELASEFDMVIGDELEVPARVLPPPKLCSKNNTQVRVNPGVIDFRNNAFYTGSVIKKWTVVVTDERVDERAVESFVETFIRQGKSTGVDLNAPLRKNGNHFHFISERNALKDVENDIETFVTQNQLEFVLFVISAQTPIHATIKFLCDVKLGVSSKCVKSTTIDKVCSNSRPGPDQCLLNILYGLNPKFNGENVVGINTEFAYMLLSTCPTLFIGIDVNHGQAKVREGHPKMPSTVGIVGTRNMNGTLYTAFMRAQRKPATSADTEVVQREVLKPALNAIFRNFYMTTRRKPERVIVYRDGVSNGQFNAVLDKEMRAIIEVCKELPGGNYRPPITFITVQKRHDSRLFPKKVTLDNRDREKQNPVAGTVVDKVMTNNKVWNFFLASHEGIQGTSKPAHYSVLFDENGFSNDQLQSLTYYLCHLYGKCPRAVSLPSPVYYAHYVAFRAAELGAHRFFQSPYVSNFDSRTHSSGSSGAQKLEEDEKIVLQEYNNAIQVKPNYAQSMYFL